MSSELWERNTAEQRHITREKMRKGLKLDESPISIVAYIKNYKFFRAQLEKLSNYRRRMQKLINRCR